MVTLVDDPPAPERPPLALRIVDSEEFGPVLRGNQALTLVTPYTLHASTAFEAMPRDGDPWGVVEAVVTQVRVSMQPIAEISVGGLELVLICDGPCALDQLRDLLQRAARDAGYEIVE